MSNTQLIQLTLFDLEALERTVRAGLKTFIEVGDALVKIRDAEGYRLRGFTTFEDYCEREFGFSVRQGQRLIAAARTADLVERVTGQTPANEAAAREFSKITGEPDAPALVERVQQVLAANGHTIGDAPAHVARAAVESVMPKPPRSEAAPAPVAQPALVEDDAWPPDGDDVDSRIEQQREAEEAAIAHSAAPSKTAPKPAPKATVKPKPEPMPDPAANGADASTDFCPACGDWPETYKRKGEAWYCGTCGGRVVIGIQPFEEA